MKNKRKETPKGSDATLTPAMSQTLSLYHAWLGYLLTQLGQKTVRVKTGDIRQALDQISCEVSREDDEYVIHLIHKEAENAHKEDGHE